MNIEALRKEMGITGVYAPKLDVLKELGIKKV
jgi:hypothetical protein